MKEAKGEIRDTHSLDLVANKEHVVLLAKSMHLGEVALRGHDNATEQT
jgi:hypothetical protein